MLEYGFNRERCDVGYYDRFVSIDELVGQVFTSVEQIDDDELVFQRADGVKYRFYHDQDCCEDVYIEDICGDLADLVGVPLELAEEVEGETPADFDKDAYESYTWTFYKFATVRGYVDVRWFGSSNGYYSEGVSLVRIDAQDEGQ